MNRPDHPGRNRGTDPVAPGARLSQTRYTLGRGVDLVLPPGAVHGDPQEVDCQRGREGYKLELTRVYSRTRCLTAAAPGRWTAGVRLEGPGCGAATCEGSRNEFHYAEREPMHRLESEHESRFGQLC